jgi:16S rRNA (guanine1207-N2)-methyltransferase
MNQSRLSLAIEASGGLAADARILLLRPGAAVDLRDFSKEQTAIVTGFFPDHAGFAARGFDVGVRPEGDFSVAIVFMPRAPALARGVVDLAAPAVGAGGTIWVDGQKTYGIDALYKDLRGRAEVLQNFTKAHGRAIAFEVTAPSDFDDWAAANQTPAEGFITRPGVFSADGVDPGSALLAEYLPADLAGKGADLGAGWGWLAAAVLTRPKVTELHLVEAEADALDCARLNLADARAVFHWADATKFHPGKAMDFVVMNPPFHQGRAADPALGAAFIRSAAAMLQPGGRLFLVANRNLPYEETLRAQFMIVTELALAGGFKILSAARPIRARPGKGR